MTITMTTMTIAPAVAGGIAMTTNTTTATTIAPAGDDGMKTITMTIATTAGATADEHAPRTGLGAPRGAGAGRFGGCAALTPARHRSREEDGGVQPPGVQAQR